MTECEAFEAWASTRLMSIEVDTAWEAWQARAALANAERARVAKRCAEIVTDWQVPVGNSDAGVLASQWTLDELRGVRAMILAEFPEAK